MAKKASENAKQVARKVVEKVGKGEKVSVGAIALEVGYSPAMAKNPQKITRTDSYQSEIKPLLAQMKKERARIMTSLRNRKYGKERLRDIIDAMDKLTKNIQLLEGRETENLGIIIETVNYAEVPPTT